MSTAGPFVTLVICDKTGMLNPGAIGAQQLSELFLVSALSQKVEG